MIIFPCWLIAFFLFRRIGEKWCRIFLPQQHSSHSCGVSLMERWKKEWFAAWRELNFGISSIPSTIEWMKAKLKARRRIIERINLISDWMKNSVLNEINAGGILYSLSCLFREIKLMPKFDLRLRVQTLIQAK